jgi:hypothetical protein
MENNKPCHLEDGAKTEFSEPTTREWKVKKVKVPHAREKASFLSPSIVRVKRRKPDFSDSTYTREENPQFSQSINAREKSAFSAEVKRACGTVIRMAG